MILCLHSYFLKEYHKKSYCQQFSHLFDEQIRNVLKEVKILHGHVGCPILLVDEKVFEEFKFPPHI